MRRALFISPHLDDVAFSCGGALATLAAAGWETTLCTVFTRSVPEPMGFALACQLDKGLAADVDYLALRRAEDAVAARALGATHVEHLDHAEAPHRGYASAPALFGEFAAEDDVAPAIGGLIAERCRDADFVFAPQALGAHVDHRRVRDAVLAAVALDAELAPRVRWYRDAPYVLRAPAERPLAALEVAYAEAASVELDATALARKLDGCAAYATQLGFQFAGDAAMRAALTRFAYDEGARAQRTVPCETFARRARELGEPPAVV